MTAALAAVVGKLHADRIRPVFCQELIGGARDDLDCIVHDASCWPCARASGCLRRFEAGPSGGRRSEPIVPPRTELSRCLRRSYSRG